MNKSESSRPTPPREGSRIDAISDDGSMPNYESWGKLYTLARTLEAELEQERDIRSTREITLSLVADGLGVEHEPHQTFDERLLEASCTPRSEKRRLEMPTQGEILLACGELKASELRAVKAALAWFIGRVNG